MKPYRIVIFLAAVAVIGLFVWALGHEDVGAEEDQSIETFAR